MISTIDLTEELFDACAPACLAKAQRLQAAVERCRADTVAGLLVLTGQVSEGERLFRCWLSFQEGGFGGDCSCGEADMCEHMAAVVLALARDGQRHSEARPAHSRQAASGREAGGAGGQYMAYLLQLSDDGSELSVCPSRISQGQEGLLATPYSLSRLADSVQPDYVTESDLVILHALTDHALSLTGLVWYPLARTSSTLLRDIIATGRCHWQAIDGPALSMGEPLAADVGWELLPSGWQQLRWQADDEAQARQLPLLPPWRLDPSTGVCRVMAAGIDDELAGRLLAAGPVSPQRVDEVVAWLQQTPDTFPRPLTLETRRQAAGRVIPRLGLCMVRSGQVAGFVATAAARLRFAYDGVELEWDDEHDSKLLGPKEVLVIERDRPFERLCRNVLEESGLAPLNTCAGRDYEPGDGGLWVPIDQNRSQAHWIGLQQRLDELRADGWQVTVAEDFSPALLTPKSWYGDLSESGNGRVEIDLGVICGGHRHSLLPSLLDWLERAPEALLRQLLAGNLSEESVVLSVDERKVVLVSMARLSVALRALADAVEQRPELADGRLELHRGRLADLAMAGEGWEFPPDNELASLGTRLASFDGIAQLDPPPGFRAELRDYQRFGLGWLQFMREFGFGGILADDMGLGKTIQTLAHILTEKRSGRMDRPCLVIAPTSLLFNWRAEARRFAPELEVLLLHGPGRKKAFGWIADSDLVLTSYPLLLRDGERLARHNWHLLILDEAQAIKNPRARISRQVREFDARHRLCLTGTPLENRLEELWSQFDFLMPGLLGSQREFRQHFAAPIERHDDRDRRDMLARRVRPFLLRRTKEQVAPELPAKSEITRTVALQGDQRSLYERVRVMLHERVRRAVQARGAERSRIVVLDALLKLRQVCCDPRLIKDIEGAHAAGSAKLELLMDLLPDLVAEGRRILLFSQFVSMLSLIEKCVKDAGIDYVKLTGRTRDRQAVVERFQSGQVPLFLISLKAGGVGLNLTAADTVIHYDPWWNPATEDQATDRAHRIGQEQKVFVYRLLTEDTIEQKVAEMQHSKRGLVEGLFGQDGGGTISAEEIEALFAPLEDEA